MDLFLSVTVTSLRTINAIGSESSEIVSTAILDITGEGISCENEKPKQIKLK
jgi:hypothetical protein